jgi:GTPase SAR1 family protein
LTIAFIGAKSVGKTSIIRVSPPHHIIPDLDIDTVVEAIVQICAGSDGRGIFKSAKIRRPAHKKMNR